MPKISRRKQSKPQHICGEDEENKEGETSNGPVGKDAVEDKNANIVINEDEDEKKEKEDVDTDETSDDVIPLDMEAEEEEDENHLRIDVEDDDITVDDDSVLSDDGQGRYGTENGSISSNSLTPTGDRVCDYCGVTKKSPSDLARHLLKHTGEHPFKCDRCDKAFKSKRSLQHHQLNIHGISIAVSMVAIDASITANRKRKSDEGSSCHSSPESETKKIKSEPPDMFSYPSMVYVGDNQTNLYMSDASCSSTGSFKGSPTPTKISPEEPNNKTCQVCGKACSKPSDLKRHMMSHTGERPFQCNICGKAFRAKNSMFYHQKSSHGLNIELSPGLQERFMKLKKQSRVNPTPPPISTSPCLTSEEPKVMTSNINPQMSSSLLLQKLGQKVRIANSSVLYSYDINSLQEGEVTLDENTGLFKQSGSIFNKPLVTQESLKPEPLKLTNSMVGMQIVQESHNVKRHICVKNETVLVTRVDGIDVLTAKDVSLYKCYLCGKMFDDLLKIQCHLSMHFQRDLTLYRCQICEDTFWFKFRVINHIRKNHPKEAKRAEKKFQENMKLKGLSDKAEDEDNDDKIDNDEDDKKKENAMEEDEDDNEKNDDKITDDGKCDGDDNQKNDKTMEDEVMSDGDEKVKADEKETEKEDESTMDETKSSDENKTIDDIEEDKEHTIENEEENKNETQNEGKENGSETTSTEANKYPNLTKDETSPSTSRSAKEISAKDLNDLSNKVRKFDPFEKLYKGIRFRKKPNGSFICLLCRKSFYKEGSLLQHIKIHNQQQVCYCEECGEGFLEYCQLRLHISSKHKNSKQAAVGSITAQRNTLLSSLLSKTSTWPKPDVLPIVNEKYLEKAREILKQEGIHDDITVVMPSEPDEEESKETRKANLDSILSNSSEDLTEPSEIKLSPKRLLMSKLLSKSKRKSSQPIKIEQVSPDEASTQVHLSGNEKEVTKPIKQEPAEPRQLPLLAPAPQKPPAEAKPEVGQPVINSELMAAKLQNLAMLHPGLHPVVMANTLATLAAQGVQVPMAPQGMFLQGGNFVPGFQVPIIGIPASTPNGAFTTIAAPQIPQTEAINPPAPALSTPVTVTVDSPKPPEEPQVKIKEEPKSPVEEVPNPFTNSDNSDNQSDDENVDKEGLVGIPRVQWNGSDSEGELRGNPSNLPSSLQQGWGFSADGRKVTSLSRTHSRLPVVTKPIDREKICKAMLLADGRSVFRCPFCNKDFLSYSDINRHLDFHEDIRPFKCKYCEYYARTNSQLKVHMMRHQGIREFCCKLCNYKGVTQSDLNRHMKSQIHLLKMKHACPHCDEGFVTPRNLERHLNGNCIVKMQMLENGKA